MNFKGKKTYIVAILLAAVTFATAMGWLTADTAEVLFGLLTAGGLATLRDGINSK